MKKILLSSSITLLILCLLALCACSNKDDATELSTDTLEGGSVEGSEHLSPSPDESDSVTFVELETTESTQTKTQTETETETETETQTQKVEETTTEKQTEAETEPAPSLKFISYGNGTCGVAGIGSYTDVYIIIPERSPSGDIVTTVEDKAFFENTDIKAIQIPSTVTSIGERAFGGCTSLVYITVDQKNKAFCDVDGILYSKDGSTLIMFPAASRISEISISVKVTKICDMAFFGCESLTSIKYGGSLQSWSNINIGDGNYGLYSASITFATTTY
jgi:hypothetical protein